MSDPGTHAIEGPAFVISHSARKVVGGATPPCHLLLQWCPFTCTMVHATISLLDVPTTFRITVAKWQILDTAPLARYGYIDSYFLDSI